MTSSCFLIKGFVLCQKHISFATAGLQRNDFSFCNYYYIKLKPLSASKLLCNCNSVCYFPSQ